MLSRSSFRPSGVDLNQQIMRPSHPGLGLPGYSLAAHPGLQPSGQPGGGTHQPGHQQLPGARGPHNTHKPSKYFPSLSGSETDVSTSTENLTQVSELSPINPIIR